MTLFLINSSYCQFKPQEEIQRIDLKLEKFRKQHQIGTLMIIGGALISSVPYLVAPDFFETRSFLVLGGVIALSGTITSIDSYKHLKLESKRQMNQEPSTPAKPKKPKNWWTPR